MRILEKSTPCGTLLGIDRDPEALAMASQTLRHYQNRVYLRHGNFSDLQTLAVSAGFPKVDGMLFDLGVSSNQLAQAERGFSFKVDGPLDMRMDPSQGQTAADLLKVISPKDLEHLLRNYGEERYARRIAKAVVEVRQQEPIRTTSQLSAVVRKAIPLSYRRSRLHYATRTFQALRIAVNQELENLRIALLQAADILAPGGKICAISFHSLEDRIVKRTFQELSSGPQPVLTILTKKPCTPKPEEREINPRSRSAKLRVAERLPE